MPNIESASSERQRSLRISRVVRNRSNEGSRVKYDVDAPGTPAIERTDRRGIPEEVVLVRWRHRSRSGRTYTGVRLPPGIWRALPIALGDDVRRWRRLSVEEVESLIEASRDRRAAAGNKGTPLRLPSGRFVHALIAVLGTPNLRKLIDRHTEPARHAKPGVPDLFLYAVSDQGRIESPRFVEVKKPDEKLYAHQASEISFMKHLGLDVRVLRLLEADRRASRRRSVSIERSR